MKRSATGIAGSAAAGTLLATSAAFTRKAELTPLKIISSLPNASAAASY